LGDEGPQYLEEKEPKPAHDEPPLAPGVRDIAAPVPGSIWQVQVQPGDSIQAGADVMIIESMKMAVRVLASASGVIASISAVKRQVVHAG
jgi:urea carboxylase